MATSDSLHDVLARLGDDDLMTLVGPATWAKGLTYFRAGKVLEVQDEPPLRALGRVRGSGVTYRTWIEAVSGELSMSCACSQGRDCRHCVATVLELRDRIRRATPTRRTWRTVMSTLVSPSGAQGEPLALVVDTHDPARATTLVPLRPGQRQEWTAKRASWPDLTNPQWASVTDDLNPTHLALLREGYRLSRRDSQWRSPNEVTLESIGEGAGNWLRRLERAGVTLLVGTDPLEPLVLDRTPWWVQVDVRRTTGGVLVDTVATDGTRNTPHPRVSPATGLLFLEGGTRLAELRGGEELREHVPADGLLVPEADLAEFSSVWLPRLERAFGVVSSDGSIDPGTPPEPTLVATVRMDGPSSVAVRWWVEYTVADSTSRTPLERVREDAAVKRLRREVETAGARLHLGEDLMPPRLRTLHLAAWRAPEFLSRVVDRLSVEGLVWDVSEGVRDVRVDPAGMVVEAGVEQTESPDWFGLRMRLLVGGHEVPLPDVLEAVSSGADHVEVDGTWVAIDPQRLERLRTLLEQARLLGDGETGEGLPRVSLLQEGLWEDATEIADHVEEAEEWTRRLRGIRGHGDLSGLPVSTHTLATLRPYQEQGHRWLTALAREGLGGVLADDMGLGKTLQILSAVQSLRDASGADAHPGGPVLVVAPTSVLGTWAHEARRFTPDLHVVVVPATAKRRGAELEDLVRGADVVVTSYTIVRLEPEAWASIAWSGLVLDEAQAVKNPRTVLHRALEGIRSDWSVAVTGTPVENSVGDLWSILRLVTPGLLPGWKVFTTTFRKPIESGSDPQALEHLHRLTAPFVLRRTKEQVAPDLPDKTESIVEVELGEEHRRLYDQYLTRERSRLLGLLDDLDANRMDVLASLTRLRQLALDPALVDPRHDSVGSAKIELLADQLDQILPSGHQVLVFSQFTRFLGRIRDALSRRGIEVAYLDGATRDREGVIESFRSGARPVFLISLKAGGTGLTLTEADYVYVMDPWWNPAAEAQAVDRAHRIGQTHKVNVYRLVAEDTIEQKVVELQEHKKDLVEAVVDGGGTGSGRISAEDLRGLLED